MKQSIGMFKRFQTGALGVFMCVVMVIVFGLISLQNVTKTSLDLYLSNSKQHIENARQLAFAGLRHYSHNYGDDDAIQIMIDTYKNNPKVVGVCSENTALPDTLVPEIELANPRTPNDDNNDVVIRGIVVPWNCDRPLHEDNYRATFEILASVNCTGNAGVDSGCVKRSFVIDRVDNHNGTLPYKPTKSVPDGDRPPGRRPPGDRTDSDGEEDIGF